MWRAKLIKIGESWTGGLMAQGSVDLGKETGFHLRHNGKLWEGGRNRSDTLDLCFKKITLAAV